MDHHVERFESVPNSGLTAGKKVLSRTRISTNLVLSAFLSGMAMFGAASCKQSARQYYKDKTIATGQSKDGMKRVDLNLVYYFYGDPFLEVKYVKRFITNDATCKVYDLFLSSSISPGSLGAEKVQWSQDGRFFLVSGNAFFTDDSAKIRGSSNVLYLMFDTQKWRLWCNDLGGDYERFEYKDAAANGFTNLSIYYAPSEPASGGRP